MQSNCVINKVSYCWVVHRETTQFDQFLMPHYGIKTPDVLHIWNEDLDFDIAIRINKQYQKGEYINHHLGPALVLGGNFPSKESPLRKGLLFRLRPKLIILTNGEVSDAVTQKVIQWCKSSNFRAVEVNPMGGVVQKN